MKRIIVLSLLTLTTFIGVARAATVTVLIADDGVNLIGAPGSFYWAITNAGPGDTIAFNIPGPGPHYLKVPPNGFPLVYQKNNLLIDGYSQPGSSRNTNAITSSNNAVIKIVIDGRNGNSRDMAYEAYDGTLATSVPAIDNTSMALERSGYGHDELALLGIYRSSGVTVRGIAFLGTLTPVNSGVVKGICLAHDYGLVTNVLDRFSYTAGSDANFHANGCWFGVDPANPTIAGVAQSGFAISAYRHRAASGDPRPELPNIGLTVGAKAASTNARAEFNVFVGLAYAFDCEGIRGRVSGNFFGVMPDGVTPYNTTELQPAAFAGGQFEFGRYDDTVAIVIGTDGDSFNDADEGNIFGPLAPISGSMQSQFDFFNSGRKPWIIAGNRFGIAGNGTIWTNNAFYIGSFRLDQGSQVRFGSDFNGVSDALEANVVYNNNTFTNLYPDPTMGIARSLFAVLNNTAATDGWLSVRGNKFVNNFPLYNPDEDATRYFNSWSNYTAGATQTVPTLLTNSTRTNLIGTCGLPTNNYTNLVIDVYLPDPEGQVNGALMDYPFFGGTNGPGFVQGKTYLGNFLDNGPQDSNPAVGAFSLNISSLGLTNGTKVTVAVTYSRFAHPKLAAPIVGGGTVTLSWTGDNGGPFNVAGAGGPSSGFGVQSATSITGPWTTKFVPGNLTFYSAGSPAAFYRVVAPLSGMTTLCAAPVVLQ